MTTKNVLALLSWLFVWVIGCVIFDAILELKGAWMMAAGVFTYWICQFVRERIER